MDNGSQLAEEVAAEEGSEVRKARQSTDHLSKPKMLSSECAHNVKMQLTQSRACVEQCLVARGGLTRVRWWKWLPFWLSSC